MIKATIAYMSVLAEYCITGMDKASPEWFQREPFATLNSEGPIVLVSCLT